MNEIRIFFPRETKSFRIGGFSGEHKIVDLKAKEGGRVVVTFKKDGKKTRLTYVGFPFIVESEIE